MYTHTEAKPVYEAGEAPLGEEISLGTADAISLQAQLDAARAVLRAYADPGRWYTVDMHDGCGPWSVWRKGKGWQLARDVLEEEQTA